jgi:DNA-binding transcriptional regulator YiaG
MMTHAYDEIYLESAQKAMGSMFHFAVYDLKWNLDKFVNVFISTGVARLMQKGCPDFVAGKSGYEVAYEVYYRLTGSYCEIKPDFSFGKSPEYFAGWSSAYYSWYKNIPYDVLFGEISAETMVNMYHPYHEMDIIQFVDSIDACIIEKQKDSQLKRLRMCANLTQKQLALRSGVSQRMIEQYEQGRKNLNHASVSTVKQLAVAIGCSIEQLLR